MLSLRHHGKRLEITLNSFGTISPLGNIAKAKEKAKREWILDNVFHTNVCTHLHMHTHTDVHTPIHIHINSYISYTAHHTQKERD